MRSSDGSIWDSGHRARRLRSTSASRAARCSGPAGPSPVVTGQRLAVAGAARRARFRFVPDTVASVRFRVMNPGADPRLPEKPTVDGLEDRWASVWQEQGTYRFDRSKTREQIYSIDT